MTTREVVLRPEAARDIEEARDWYDAQEPDLGAEFIEEIDAKLTRVAQLPEATHSSRMMFAARSCDGSPTASSLSTMATASRFSPCSTWR